MTDPTKLTCPRCGQKDQIQKVTGLYQANTKEWRETHGSGRSRSTSFHRAHTLLGEKLAPPERPSTPFHPAIGYGIVAFLVLTIGGGFCWVPFVFVIPLIGILFDPEVSRSLGEAGLSNWLPYAGLACMSIILLVIAAVALWALIAVVRRFQKDMANYNNSKAKIDSEEMPRWQRAMDRWNQLYYCSRDETVFIPGENRAIPDAQMKDYLFDPYYRPF